MKKIVLTSGGLFFIFLSVAVLADTFFQSDFKKPDEAEVKWGMKALDKALFRSGDHASRASMAVDIVKKNLYVGSSMKLVRQELGDPDSYFF